VRASSISSRVLSVEPFDETTISNWLGSNQDAALKIDVTAAAIVLPPLQVGIANEIFGRLEIRTDCLFKSFLESNSCRPVELFKRRRIRNRIHDFIFAVIQPAEV
jgi:hypothetical protein